MVESIGLIERAAALLRQREAEAAPPSATPAAAGFAPPATGAAPAEFDDADIGSAELILDRGQLASFGVAIPSA